MRPFFGLKMHQHLYDNYYVWTYWWIGTFKQGTNFWHWADAIIALGDLQETLKEGCSTSTLDYREPLTWRIIFCECYVRYIILPEQGKKTKITKQAWNIVLIAQNAISVSHHYYMLRLTYEIIHVTLNLRDITVGEVNPEHWEVDVLHEGDVF